MSPTRLILDTDIGSDVDDALALALILASPELQLDGVTCVTGDVLLRARIALKLLSLRGREDVPVFAGAAKPMLEHRPVWVTGDEGGGLLGPEDDALLPSPGSAADFIVRKVMANPGQIHLVCIAPLTNIASALLLEPRVAQNVARLTIMGGALRGLDRLDLGYSESNIDYDPLASDIVFRSGAPITLVPLDVTQQVVFRRADNALLRSVGTPFHDALAEQVDRFPYIRSHGQSHMHDPLTAALLLAPDLVTTRSLHVDIETQGRYTLGATLLREPSDDAPANADVAIAVDAARFEALLLERLQR